MSSYSLIIEKEHIKIFKNKNKFKLEVNFEVESECDIIEKFKTDEIYKIIKALNKDYIEYLKVNKQSDEISDITLVLNNLDNTDDSKNNDKYYLSFDRNIVLYKHNNIIINGNPNSVEFVKDKFKKIYFDNFNINLNIDENNKLLLVLKLKVNHNNNLLSDYFENLIAKLVGKFFLRLIKYYGKKNL